MNNTENNTANNTATCIEDVQPTETMVDLVNEALALVTTDRTSTFHGMRKKLSQLLTTVGTLKTVMYPNGCDSDDPVIDLEADVAELAEMKTADEFRRTDIEYCDPTLWETGREILLDIFDGSRIENDYFGAEYWPKKVYKPGGSIDAGLFGRIVDIATEMGLVWDSASQKVLMPVTA